MSENRALAVVPTEAEVQASMTIAKAFVEAGYWQDANTIAKAFVKVQAGREWGIPPFAAMSAVHIIQGKPTMAANAIAAKIKASGKYDYRVVELSPKVCTIAFLQGGQEIGRESFTMEDAERASLTKNPTWRSYPKNMLFARAISNGARFYCADVFAGAVVYTPEEMGAQVDGESGEVVSIPAESVRVIEPQPAQRLDNPAPVHPTNYVEPPAKVIPPTFDPGHGGQITANQLRAIYAIGRDKLGMSEADIDEKAMETYGLPTNGITKAQASEWITAMQNGQLPLAN